MYSQRDMLEMDARIRRGWVILLPVEAAIAAALVFALVKRVHWLALAAGALLVVVAMAGIIGYLWPNLRYRRFLRDMASGLSRDVRGVRNAGWRLAIQIYSPNAAKRDKGLAELGFQADYNITDLMEIPGIIRKTNEEG